MLPIVRSNWMPSIFDDLMTTGLWNDGRDNSSSTNPKVNIIENDKEYRIELAAPGLSKEDIKIDLNDNLLTLSSEKQDVKEESNEEYWKREFGYSSFKRTFTIPETVNADKITAEYTNGILDVHIPKKAEAVQKAPRQITVK